MNDSKIPPKVKVLPGEENLLLGHNYDGIEELDHVLPRWWLWLFYITMVFAAWYAGYYLLGSGPSSRQELTAAMKELDALKPTQVPETGNSAEALLAAFKDPTKINHGKEIFAAKCVACHGANGQGVIGPNLTDDFWIHGKGTLKDIASVIATGVPDKGMPPWGPLLTAEEQRDVGGFVHSIHGTNPAGAKPPQGEKQDFKD